MTNQHLNPMLTKNTDKLRREVAAHVAADTIIQGTYWNTDNQRGCFIGCLAHANDPALNEAAYGLPVMVQRIAENIFEALPADEAKEFFAALPDAVGCDGKDLSRVGWQFLAAELRSLPPQPSHIQEAINPVIAGMDLLAANQDWPHAEATAATAAAAYAYATAATAAAAHSATAAAEAYSAAAEAYSDACCAYAALYGGRRNPSALAAAHSAYAALSAAHSAYAHSAHSAHAAYAAVHAAVDAAAHAAYAADARLRQRDLLLRLIAEAPVVENTND